MTTAYPLKWPEGWARGQKLTSGAGRFKTTFDKSKSRFYHEMELLGATHVVISSNLPLRLDGQPRADIARYKIGDPGVAIYFMLRGKQMVMARDAYESVYDNFHSLVLAIEHLRGLERHGGGVMMERAFSGFMALPEPGNAAHRRAWWQVLGFTEEPPHDDNGFDNARDRYRLLARERHPDAGGSHEQMAELNAAWEKAQEVLGA